MWPPTAPACATRHPPTSTCEVGNTASRSKTGTRPTCLPSLGLTASGLPCPLQTPAGRPSPAGGRGTLGQAVSLWASVSLPVKWGQLPPPTPVPCDGRPMGCRTWGGGAAGGNGGGGPSGAYRAGGACRPLPHPARPPIRVGFCGVLCGASPCCVLALLLQTRGLVAPSPLHRPPPAPSI